MTRLLAAIPHGHSSPVLENSVFELTDGLTCKKLVLRHIQRLGASTLPESPAAKPGFRRFGPSGATRKNRHDESANESTDVRACQISTALNSVVLSLASNRPSVDVFTCSHVDVLLVDLLLIFLQDIEHGFRQQRLDRAVLFHG